MRPLPFQPAECLVEGAGGEPHPGEGLDVLGQGVAMLRSIGQAGHDQRGRSGVAAEGPTRWACPPACSASYLLLGHLASSYIGSRSIGGLTVMGRSPVDEVGDVADRKDLWEGVSHSPQAGVDDEVGHHHAEVGAENEPADCSRAVEVRGPAEEGTADQGHIARGGRS